MRINLTGALICSKAAVPLFEARGGGKIVNQLSAGGFPAQTPYGISKVALLGLTTTLATELGRMNVNVNAIAPGMTMSDAGKALTPEESPFVQARSEEHTSELQSLMRISYAVFCLKKKKNTTKNTTPL